MFLFVQKPRTPSDADNVKAPKPPADPNRPVSGVRRPSSRQRILQHSNSIDTPSNESSTRTRSGSLQDGKSIRK